MKKLVLSISTIFLFMVYALYQKASVSATNVDITLSENPISTTVKMPEGLYRDGTYTGDSIDALYGFIKVKAVIKDGRLSDVKFLQYPNDRSTSMMINKEALPILKFEAIKIQSANVEKIQEQPSSLEENDAVARVPGVAQPIGAAVEP